MYKYVCVCYTFSSFRVVAAAAGTTKFGRFVVVVYIFIIEDTVCVPFIILYLLAESLTPPPPRTTLGKTPSPAPAVTYIGTNH